MRKQRQGFDARGKPVRIHDRILHKDGNIYDVCATPKNLRRVHTIHASPLDRNPPFVLLKLEHCLKVRRITKHGSKKKYKAAWAKFVKPILRKKRRQRKRVEAMPTRLCPMCEVVWFKLGVPVWKGKKLRVCCTHCKREVVKEVRLVASYGVDKEKARRKAAYKYMKKGQQL